MSFLLALLVPGSALAVAPHDLEGAEPVRIRHTSEAGQLAFRRSPLWQAFLRGEGKGWKVRADERAGTPHRMWGGLPLFEGHAEEAEVVELLVAFTRRNAELLGAHDLPFRVAGFDADFDTWYVDFQSMRDDVPIWRSTLTFRVKHGNLVLVGADTYPRTPTVNAFDLTAEEAVSIGLSDGPAPGVEHTDVEAEAFWLPRVEHGQLVLRAVFEVTSSTEEPRGDWHTFVDAASGEVLTHYNAVRYLTGTVSATLDDRYPGNGTQTRVVPYAAVTNGVSTVAADANGVFTIADSTSYQTHFLSDPIYLQDELGNVGLDFTNGSPTWNASNGSIAAMDTFVWLHEVREVFNQVVPNESFTTADLQATVNIADVCNAYYDGTVNFFQAGSGCSNTGRLADVVYHEWGHGFHQYRIVTGSFDGALSEGAGDTTSFLMTEDASLAPGFYQSGGFLRTVDNDNRYPDDVVNQVHTDGLIFGGAMWDSHQNIAAGNGTPYATEVMKRVFSGLLTGGPDIESSIDEALVADDDDGNLANGTPHSCYIEPAFADHGLGQGGAVVSFTASHEPVARAEGGGPITIGASIEGPPGCAADFQSSGATLSWRANGGAWTDTPMASIGFDVTAAIPPQIPGTFIEYVVAIEGDGQTLRAPVNGQNNPFSFYVGDVIEVRCDDFESGDGGYTHQLLAGEPNEGADDWQHGAPNGRGGDPLVAHSGQYVWGNDLGFDDYNGAYQADKHNRLTGPTIELGHYEDPFLSYWRWLTVEDAVYDQASILANGQTVWTNLSGSGQNHHYDAQWAPHAVDLGDVGSVVQVSFDLQSDGGLEMGGWTIDDVCVYVPASVNNRLGVTDFQAGEGREGSVALTWTNPVHGPLDEVRVVRKSGSCPSGVDDGEVVFFDSAPELGAAVTASDAVPTTDTYCYAVFPGDGTSFLGWVVEGWNADQGSATSPASDDEIEEQQEENGVVEFENAYAELSGCGCASGPAGGWWGALPFALLALARRRR